jgi:hypothetical protein
MKSETKFKLSLFFDLIAELYWEVCSKMFGCY